MTSLVRFRPAAEHDLLVAFQWYEERRAGLGVEFLEAADAVISAIVENPESSPVVRSRIRRAVFRRFPYLLFYVIEPREIVVLACLHASRDPEIWPT